MDYKEVSLSGLSFSQVKQTHYFIYNYWARRQEAGDLAKREGTGAKMPADSKALQPCEINETKPRMQPRKNIGHTETWTPASIQNAQGKQNTLNKIVAVPEEEKNFTMTLAEFTHAK